MTSKNILYAICMFLLTMTAILATLALWYRLEPAGKSKTDLSEKPATKQETHSYVYVGGPIVMTNSNVTRTKREAKGQCAPKKHYSFGVQICIPTGTITTITIPLSSLKEGKDAKNGIEYANEYWYLTNDQLSQGWDTLVADQDNKWTPQQAKTKWAVRQAELLTLTKMGLNLVLTVNNVKRNLTSNGEECWGFLLRVYTAGTDPIYKLFICEMPPKTTKDTSTEPVLSPLLQGSGVKVKATATLTKEQVFNIATGMSDYGNNWLTMVEQATKHVNKDCVACMGPRPLLRMVPTPPELTTQCIEEILTKTTPNKECAEWDAVYPLTKPEKQKPIFAAKLPKANYTCAIRSNSEANVFGSIDVNFCARTLNTTGALPKIRSDIYWYCGGKILRGNLPTEFTGVCALVSLIIPIEVIPLESEQLKTFVKQIPGGEHKDWKAKREYKRRWGENDPTYIDAIGVPRGVPDEYKLVDQVATGFENLPVISAIIPITPNKNADRINYIHYNVQKLGNYTQAGLEAVHEQLSATSLMAFQNRIAVDMLLLEKGGVCGMLGAGHTCCVVIPNNTAADGSLTRAIGSLRAMNRRLKEQSGVSTTFWDDWLNVFGRYRALASSILISIAVFVSILTLCGCCCIPCLRSLINRLITTAIAPLTEGTGVPINLLEGSDEEDPEGALPNLFQETSQV
ncbi:hypothetical protein NL108_016390 [Boleophthalmus pectinirostris]|nr:hypothetical protein NL108_016390 [Boleophthalmus pectinirostris]